jgi:hypothetical protein
MVTRQRVSTNAGIGQLNFDSLTYDHRGKVIKATTDSRVQAPESVAYVYDVHGAVVAQERSRGAGSYHVEEFRNDAYGNAFFSRTRSSTGANDAPSVAFFNPDAALYDRHTVLPGTVQQNHREEMLTQGAGFRHGEFAGQLVEDVAGGLRRGSVSPDQLPIQVVGAAECNTR